MRRHAGAVILLVAGGCASLTTGVRWEPTADAPELSARGDGCYVEVYERGREPARPHQVVGTLLLELSGDEVRSGGGKGVAERFQKAACERGAFVVKDVKTYPNSTTGSVLYEASAAVLLDEDGEPLRAATQEESSSEEPASAEETP